MGDLEVEVAGFEIGGNPEVMEVAGMRLAIWRRLLTALMAALAKLFRDRLECQRSDL
jgi:hypothetical protein